MDRRQFLRMAGTIAVTTPVIAQAIILPELSRGFSFSDEVSRKDLDNQVRFANAIYTPGSLYYTHKELFERASAVLPYGTRIDIRAVPFSASRMKGTYCGLKRDGFAVLWITGTDHLKEDRFIRLGSHTTGGEWGDAAEHELYLKGYDEFYPSYEEYIDVKTSPEYGRAYGSLDYGRSA